MDLEDQLVHLDATLLGSVTTQFPDPLSESEKAQVHAYLVLAHAVLEEYIESVFSRHFDRLCSWLSADLVPAECVRFSFAVAEMIPSASVSYRKRITFDLIRGLGRTEFQARLNRNHGLKARNVENLAQLVGVEWVRLESTLNSNLADLNTLGSKRGAAGHLSPYTEKVTSISTSDGPDDVRRWVRDGREAAVAIERYLDSLVRAQQPISLIADWDGN